ncbi:MAG: acyltransferase [Bacilli bacterium]|nr:acyltransferase [Bacilli bacterium]
MVLQNPFAVFKKDRIFKFDLLKLFAALLVILDHTMTRWIPSIQTTQLYNFIFLTQMPLFMFIAGRLAFTKLRRITDGKSLLNVFLNNVFALLIPFIVFSLIKSFVVNGFTIDALKYFGSCFEIPQNSVWFLWSLFWIENFFFIGCYFSNKFLQKNESAKIGLCFGIIILLYFLCWFLYYFVGNKLDLYYIFFYSIFFTFGLLITYLLENLNIFPTIKGIILLISIGSLTLVMIFHPTTILDSNSVANVLIKIAGGFSSVIACSIVAEFLSNFKPVQYVSKCGAYSLELYIVHLFLLYGFELAFKPVDVTAIGIFTFIIYYLVVVLASFAAIFLLKSFKPTDLILFGKFKINLKEKR